MGVKLNDDEAGQLQEHEQTIQEGLHTFVQVGAALSAIRDAKLYRAEFGTFELYCRERWGWSQQHVTRICRSAEVASNITKSETMVSLPTSERVARPLTKLPPAEQPAAWQEAIDTAPEGKVTSNLAHYILDIARAGVSLIEMKMPVRCVNI